MRIVILGITPVQYNNNKAIIWVANTNCENCQSIKDSNVDRVIDQI